MICCVRTLHIFRGVVPREQKNFLSDALQGFGYAQHVLLAGIVAVGPQAHAEVTQCFESFGTGRAGCSGYGPESRKSGVQERSRGLFGLRQHYEYVGPVSAHALRTVQRQRSERGAVQALRAVRPFPPQSLAVGGVQSIMQRHQLTVCVSQLVGGSAHHPTTPRAPPEQRIATTWFASSGSIAARRPGSAISVSRTRLCPSCR